MKKMDVYKKQTDRVIRSLDQVYNKFVELEEKTTDEAEICAYRGYYNNVHYAKQYIGQMQAEIDRLEADIPKITLFKKEMTGKEQIIYFLSRLIPAGFKCGHISATFGDDDSLIVTVNNCEIEDGEQE